jgi:hypothetical protein
VETHARGRAGPVREALQRLAVRLALRPSAQADAVQQDVRRAPGDDGRVAPPRLQHGLEAVGQHDVQAARLAGARPRRPATAAGHAAGPARWTPRPARSHRAGRALHAAACALGTPSLSSSRRQAGLTCAATPSRCNCCRRRATRYRLLQQPAVHVVECGHVDAVRGWQRHRRHPRRCPAAVAAAARTCARSRSACSTSKARAQPSCSRAATDARLPRAAPAARGCRRACTPVARRRSTPRGLDEHRTCRLQLAGPPTGGGRRPASRSPPCQASAGCRRRALPAPAGAGTGGARARAATMLQQRLAS